jgi:hypothetical protein
MKNLPNFDQMMQEEAMKVLAGDMTTMGKLEDK